MGAELDHRPFPFHSVHIIGKEKQGETERWRWRGRRGGGSHKGQMKGEERRAQGGAYEAKE